jgi:hypothetical protein
VNAPQTKQGDFRQTLVLYQQLPNDWELQHCKFPQLQANLFQWHHGYSFLLSIKNTKTKTKANYTTLATASRRMFKKY